MENEIDIALKKGVLKIVKLAGDVSFISRFLWSCILGHFLDIMQDQFFESFEFTTELLSWKLSKSYRKYFHLVAIRKGNFDGYSASKFVAMSFQIGGCFLVTLYAFLE